MTDAADRLRVALWDASDGEIINVYRIGAAALREGAEWVEQGDSRAALLDLADELEGKV